MASISYNLKSEYIELYKLLKLVRIAATGGHAKILIEEGEVKVNDKTDFRKRAKIRCGDIVTCQDNDIIVR